LSKKKTSNRHACHRLDRNVKIISAKNTSE